MTAPLVGIAGVEKRFPGADGGITALVSVSAEVAEGTLTGLRSARTGAGKTTLLRLVAGLMVPDAGSVSVFGRPAAALGAEGRVELGYLPHPRPADLVQRVGAQRELSHPRRARGDHDAHGRAADLAAGRART